jgi:hypothetical protein
MAESVKQSDGNSIGIPQSEIRDESNNPMSLNMGRNPTHQIRESFRQLDFDRIVWDGQIGPDAGFMDLSTC